MSILRSTLPFALVLFGGTVSAHEGHDHGDEATHVQGTVESFSGEKLVVKATDGKTVNVHVDDKTAFENSGAAGKAQDLKPGAKLVVMGEPMKDGTLHATKIRFGKTPKKISGRQKVAQRLLRSH